MRTQPRRASFRSMLWLLVWVALCQASAGGASADSARPEYEVKAAFLLNFTRFVDWPPSLLPEDNAPFTICVFGDDPFGTALDQLIEGEAVGAHKLAVKRIRRLPSPKSCQVLYVSRSEGNAAGLLSELPPGTLTVGDRETFLHEGGIIAFVIEGHRVRFDISIRAAAKGGLTISSRLLSVARNVQK